MGKNTVLLFTFFSFMAYTLDFISYAPLAPGIITDMGLSYTQSGFIVSLTSLIYAAFMIPMGMLCDRWGGKRILTLGLAMMGLSTLVFPFSPSYGIILITRAFLGIGGAALITSSIKLVSVEFLPSEQDKAFGIWGMGWGVGLLATFFLMPVIARDYGWETGFYLTGTFTIVLFLLSIIMLGHVRASTQPVRRVPVRLKRLIRGNFFPAVGVRFTGIFVVIGTMTWMPFYLKDFFHISSIDAGYVGVLLGALTIPASAAGGILSKRWGKKPIIITSMLMCLLSPFIFIYTPSLGIAVLAIALLGWGSMFWSGPTVAIISTEADGAVGLRYGMFESFGFTGSFVAPLVMGFVLDSTGSFRFAFMFLGIGAAIGLIGGLLLRENNRLLR